MTELPDGEEFHGFSYALNPENPTFVVYLPGEPTSEKDTQGKSTLMVWVIGSNATLQMSTHWSVAPDELQALGADLQARFPQQVTLATLHFTPAPVTITRVSVLTGDGTGHFDLLKTVTSSGFPPYTALFNVPLSPDQRTSVTAALNGRTGFLTVEYRGTLSSPVLLQTKISGDVQADIAELAASSPLSDADALARVNLALDQGRLTLRHVNPVEGVAELQAQVDQEAKTRAATLFQQMVQNAASSISPDSSLLTASASLHSTRSISIVRSSDVQTWFAAGEGPQHLRILSTDN